MKSRIPKVYNGILEQRSPEGIVVWAIPIESSAWYEWLEHQRSFRFEHLGTGFTARKERRSSGWYWYAYRRKESKLATAYLGKSQGLTLERLQRAAVVIDSKFSGPGEALQQKKPSRSPQALRQEILLITKLQAPPLHPNLVPRLALIEHLNAQRFHKLILLSASAGSGKTTLLSQWAASSSWPVAWLSLDGADNDPASFWNYIIAALEKLHTGIGKHALALLRSPQPAPLEAILSILINAIAALARDIVLVLDDYHFIVTQAIHDTLLFFLDHLPANMHLLISSRVDPPLPLSRWLAHRQAAELRTSNLRFTSDEVAAFFSITAGLKLSAEAVASLETCTEGWVAGLQLAALSLQRSRDVTGFLTVFSGGDTPLFDYLANEVWRHQPRAVRRFLVKVAILERLNGPLCDALTGRTHSQQTLEQLERANLFIVPLDNQRQWYRLHHLFRAFLRNRLRALQPERTRKLHLRASTWYEHNALTTEAINHAFVAGDFLRAARLIMDVGQTMIHKYEVVTLLEWLNALPEELVTSLPRLCLFRGWTNIVTGQFISSQIWLERAQEGLNEKAQPLLPCTPQELALLGGEIATLRSHLAIFLEDIPSALTFAHQALSLLPEHDFFLRSLSELTFGVANWLNGDVQAAIQALTKAKVMGQAANNVYAVLTASCIFIHIQMGQGQLRRAFQNTQQALRLATETECRPLWATACVYISLGQLLYIWNDLEEAVSSLQEGIALGMRWQHRDLLVYGYTIMAQVKHAQNDPTSALKMIQLAAAQAIQANSPRPWVVSVMATLQIRVALLQKNFDAIERWQQTHMCNYVKTFEQRALAQIYLAQGQTERALNILEEQLRIAEETQQFGRVIDIRSLQALAYQKQHATRKALQALEQALVLGEPEQYIRSFIDRGPALIDLLKTLLVRQTASRATSSYRVSTNYLRQLLTAFGVPGDFRPTQDGAQAGTGSVKGLSKREIEIIHLIVSGLSTREIAEKIILAENTVKWHIRKIYEKLQVHNRAQIILQAQELGI